MIKQSYKGNVIDMWAEIFSNYTLRTVLLGTVVLGLVSGIVGVFLTLKKESLVGDALSHATLPGVVLAFIITEESSLYISVLGAIIASIVSLVLIDVIKTYTKVKSDAILAVILSSMFGFGQVLLSLIRDSAGQDQSRLSKFIFGQAATMSSEDVTFLLVILSIVLVVILLFWRHFKLYIFNQEFYTSLGFSPWLIKVLLNTLVILVVVSGIQSVGVILMSALLIAPSVAARLWSEKLTLVVIISAFFGAISGLLGTIYGTEVPTGPVIVIFASSIVLISLLFAPKKGFLWVKISEHIHKKQVKKFHGLIHLYINNDTTSISKQDLSYLIDLSYVIYENQTYKLTDKGMERASMLMAGELI